VVPRDDEDWDTGLGDLTERLQRLERQGCRNPRAVEDVSSVHDQVDIPCPGGSQSPLVVGKEIVAPAPSVDPGTGGQVEPQVGVGQEEDADGVARLGHGLRTEEEMRPSPR